MLKGHRCPKDHGWMRQCKPMSVLCSEFLGWVQDTQQKVLTYIPDPLLSFLFSFGSNGRGCEGRQLDDSRSVRRQGSYSAAETMESWRQLSTEQLLSFCAVNPAEWTLVPEKGTHISPEIMQGWDCTCCPTATLGRSRQLPKPCWAPL